MNYVIAVELTQAVDIKIFSPCKLTKPVPIKTNYIIGSDVQSKSIDFLSCEEIIGGSFEGYVNIYSFSRSRSMDISIYGDEIRGEGTEESPVKFDISLSDDSFDQERFAIILVVDFIGIGKSENG